MTPSAGSGSAAAAGLLRDVLPGVSRSFALRAVLPAALGVPLGVTYLVARAADTIADTHALPATERLSALAALRQTLESERPASLIGSADHAETPLERALLRRLPDVRPRTECSRPTIAAGRGRSSHLTEAMVEVLERFPPETAGRVGAFETRADLDRYTYLNAGCRGILDGHGRGPPAALR